MRSFMAPNLQNPTVAERIPGSMFTPAIAAWSSPGALGSFGQLPSWAPFAAIAALLGLAAMRKIPWWAGIGGAAAAYYFLSPPTTNTVTPLTSGTGISANGTTISFSTNTPATLVTTPAGAQSVTASDGHSYPLISQTTNPDGSITYYLDNPTS